VAEQVLQHLHQLQHLHLEIQHHPTQQEEEQLIIHPLQHKLHLRVLFLYKLWRHPLLQERVHYWAESVQQQVSVIMIHLPALRHPSQVLQLHQQLLFHHPSLSMELHTILQLKEWLLEKE
jgi:hypothetical protein